MTHPTAHAVHELHQYLRERSHWSSIARWLIAGFALLGLVVWFGHDLIEEIEAVEHWIEGHGALGWAVFVILFIVVTSIFVPLSFMAIAGGAMFGPIGGFLLSFTSVFMGAALNYVVARQLLKTQIDAMLNRHPKLQAIQSAVEREGLRFQLLLRLSPINATSVNYVLGATGSKFPTFLVATAGLIPAVIANVYFGHSASHVTKYAGQSGEHSTLQTVVTVIGLAICVLVMIGITRIASKAIADAGHAQAESSEPANLDVSIERDSS